MSSESSRSLIAQALARTIAPSSANRESQKESLDLARRILTSSKSILAEDRELIVTEQSTLGITIQYHTEAVDDSSASFPSTKATRGAGPSSSRGQQTQPLGTSSLKRKPQRLRLPMDGPIFTPTPISPRSDLADITNALNSPVRRQSVDPPKATTVPPPHLFGKDWILEGYWHLEFFPYFSTIRKTQHDLFRQGVTQNNLNQLSLALSQKIPSKSQFKFPMALTLGNRVSSYDPQQLINMHLLRCACLLSVDDPVQALTDADNAFQIAQILNGDLNLRYQLESKCQLYRGLCFQKIGMERKARIALTRGALWAGTKGWRVRLNEWRRAWRQEAVEVEDYVDERWNSEVGEEARAYWAGLSEK